MIKIVPPNGWDFGDKICEMVKVASGGRLVGKDYQDLVKRAGARFAYTAKMADFKPGESPLHVIAMGSTEFYSNNRNGDGFKQAMLTQYHPTFVKKAHFYRHHKHNDPTKSYGRVVDSDYSDSTHRVELLIGLNSTKEAAAANNGLLADLEMEKLASGQDIPVSMAIHVPYDECASCFNKAKTRANYCTEDTCISPSGIKRGGCMHNLAKVAFDGFINHVDNPSGEFFDISHVTVPADRIAYGSTATYLMKVASGEEWMGGAAMAEALGLLEPLPLRLMHVFDSKTTEHLKLAYQLAELENEVNRDLSLVKLARSFKIASTKLPVEEFGEVNSRECKKSLAKLGQLNICLSPQQFLQFVGSQMQPGVIDKLASDFYQALPGVFNRLAASPDFEQLTRNNQLAVEASSLGHSDLNHLEKYAADYSLTPGYVQTRIIRSAVRGQSNPEFKQIKVASATNIRAEALARLYSMYKVSHLAAQPEEVRDLTAKLLVVQNYQS
jgi:hypothetical protein